MNKAISAKTTQGASRADDRNSESLLTSHAQGRKRMACRFFYRAAGDPNAPVILAASWIYPASSFMFRELIPRLANDYRV